MFFTEKKLSKIVSFFEDAIVKVSELDKKVSKDLKQVSELIVKANENNLSEKFLRNSNERTVNLSVLTQYLKQNEELLETQYALLCNELEKLENKIEAQQSTITEMGLSVNAFCQLVNGHHNTTISALGALIEESQQRIKTCVTEVLEDLGELITINTTDIVGVNSAMKNQHKEITEHVDKILKELADIKEAEKNNSCMLGAEFRYVKKHADKNVSLFYAAIAKEVTIATESQNIEIKKLKTEISLIKEDVKDILKILRPEKKKATKKKTAKKTSKQKDIKRENK